MSLNGLMFFVVKKLETDFLLGERRNPVVQGLEKLVTALNYIEKWLGPECRIQ